MPRTFRQWRKGLPGDPMASVDYAGRMRTEPFKVCAVEGALTLGVKLTYPVHDRGHIVYGLMPMSQEVDTGVYLCYFDYTERDPMYVESLSPPVAQKLADDLRTVQKATDAVKALANDIGEVKQVNHDLIYTPNKGEPEVLAAAGTDKWRALLKWQRQAL